MTHARSLFIAAAGAVCLTLSTAAFAQDDAAGAGSRAGSGPGMGQGMMMRHGGMGMGMGMMGCPMRGGKVTHLEGRTAFLRAELGITEAQKPAFDAFAQAFRKNAENMQSRHEKMMKMKEAKTVLERHDARVEMVEGQLASMKEMRPPLAALYEALSPEQKQKADELMVGMGCM